MSAVSGAEAEPIILAQASPGAAANATTTPAGTGTPATTVTTLPDITGSGEIDLTGCELLVGSIDAEIANERHAETGKEEGTTFSSPPVFGKKHVEVYSGGTQYRPTGFLGIKDIFTRMLPEGVEPPKRFRVIERRWLAVKDYEAARTKSRPIPVFARLDIWDAEKCPTGKRVEDCAGQQEFAAIDGSLTITPDGKISYRIKDPEVLDPNFSDGGLIAGEVKKTLQGIVHTTSEDEIEFYNDNDEKLRAKAAAICNAPFEKPQLVEATAPPALKEPVPSKAVSTAPTVLAPPPVEKPAAPKATAPVMPPTVEAKPEAKATEPKPVAPKAPAEPKAATPAPAVEKPPPAAPPKYVVRKDLKPTTKAQKARAAAEAAHVKEIEQLKVDLLAKAQENEAQAKALESKSWKSALLWGSAGVGAILIGVLAIGSVIGGFFAGSIGIWLLTKAYLNWRDSRKQAASLRTQLATEIQASMAAKKLSDKEAKQVYEWLAQQLSSAQNEPAPAKAQK